MIGLGDFFEFGHEESFFECEVELNDVGLVFEFFDGLLFDFFVPVLVVPDAFKELHQVDMLTYFLDSGLMDGFLDTHFPVDFFDHVSDISMGVGFDGLFVDEFFEVGHDDLDIDG